MLALTLLLCLLAALASCQSCFFPDGSLATGFQRCNASSAQCCFNTDPTHRDACFDNGLCISTLWGGIYRGGCSDPFWNPGSGCAKQCINENKNTVSPVTPCGTKMCCGDVNQSITCCQSKTDGFFWGNSTVTNPSCPSCDADKGLGKSDYIAIGIGVASLFVTFLAWIWPQQASSRMGRLRERIRDRIWRRRRNDGQPFSPPDRGSSSQLLLDDNSSLK